MSVTVYVNVIMSNKVVINELPRKSGGYLNSYLTKIYFLLIKKLILGNGACFDVDRFSSLM